MASHDFPSRRLLSGFTALAVLLAAGCGRDRAASYSTLPPAGDLEVTVVSVLPSLPARPAADTPSLGGTITFREIGAPGWYPSRRDPAAGVCDAYRQGDCCLARHEPSGSLAPWDEELIMTLRGPMAVKRMAVYQPETADKAAWGRVSRWAADGSAPEGIAFQGDGVPGFTGAVGNKCLVDVSTDRVFPCGPGSVPYCPSGGENKYQGWTGSKLILLEASMPHAGEPARVGAKDCSTDPKDNWYDAPWIGLSHGELIRSGKFGGCHCYSKNPAEWWLGDGCGQFNVFEVVNDNNDFQNFDFFSTNFFAYHGYVGEGPCGKGCVASRLDSRIDLIDKATGLGANSGAVASPSKGPGAAFRRPASGSRYFIILLDGSTRTVQLAVVHPAAVPAAVGAFLPDLPVRVGQAAIDALIAMRLPATTPLGVRRSP